MIKFIKWLVSNMHLTQNKQIVYDFGDQDESMFVYAVKNVARNLWVGNSWLGKGFKRGIVYQCPNTCNAPVIFASREQAQTVLDDCYDYIKRRPDVSEHQAHFKIISWNVRRKEHNEEERRLHDEVFHMDGSRRTDKQVA